MLKSILLFMAILGSSVNSYKILILYPTTSLSHQLPAMGLAEALLKKGHQVYFAGTDKLSVSFLLPFITLVFSFNLIPYLVKCITKTVSKNKKKN